jgi:hypothetical protein
LFVQFSSAPVTMDAAPTARHDRRRLLDEIRQSL